MCVDRVAWSDSFLYPHPHAHTHSLSQVGIIARKGLVLSCSHKVFGVEDLDSEGRCIVAELPGKRVLFNLYVRVRACVHLFYSSISFHHIHQYTY
jgi:hypothetical protein